MEPVLILLLMLAGVSHAFFPAGETKCNATQNTSLCSATVGGSVYIQLMTNASGQQLKCKKKLPTGSINVFSLKKERVTIQESYRNRTEFFINSGTLKITKLERSDSGQYTVDVFDPEGIQLRTINVKLDVQENISHILIPVCSAVGALLIVVVCCCVCWKLRRRKKTGK
ncbi:hypothetical protein VZT92_023353 [Zoarces viviparus]|uniref:Uncharacterized protein n=1 Tax=Zoarces viviparus TaxID=48416 RepID=A0AAW1E899_ZOAVI